MISKIKGAIFDMDGTLIDSLMLWDVIWDCFGKKYLDGQKFCPTPEDVKAVRTMTLSDAMKYLYSIYKIGNDGDDLLQTAVSIIGDFYANEVKLKKGVAEFLEYCNEKGIKMCIASATDKKLVEVAIRHCGIEKYFVKLFSCAEIGKGKDQPDIYLMAMDFLGTSKEETCVFEDSHVAIMTAHKAGLKTVGIYDRFNYGQEEMQKIATEYVADGETLEKLIAEV